MRILVSGSHGVVGLTLRRHWLGSGHEVVRLVRGLSAGPEEISWSPDSGVADADALEGFDAVVHLAGESLSGRWTAEKKTRIMASRAEGTQRLVTLLSGLRYRPPVLLSASAVGYYGDRGNEPMDERVAPGTTFLAEVCCRWEAPLQTAREMGIRTVAMRLAMVLSPDGPPLTKMLPAFRAGMAGRIGDGHQYWSWISIDDLLRVVDHLLADETLEGPVNITSPHPVTNSEFTKTLGRVLRRPTCLSMPAIVARWIWGEMADDLLVASTRAVPTRLLAGGFVFQYPELEPALRHLLVGS